MDGRLKKMKILLAEEFNEVYPFPVLEVLCFFFIFFVFLGLTTFNFTSILPPGTLILDPVHMCVKESLEQYDETLTLASLLLSVVVSIFISNSVSGTYESGVMKTFLSYPIERLELIGSKLLGTFLVFFVMMTLGIILSSNFSPVRLPLSSLAGSILSIALVLFIAIAVSFILSIFLKKTMVALATSISFWFLVYISITSIKSGYAYIFKPSHVLVMWGFDESLTLADMCIALLGPVLISAVLILAGFIYVKKKFEV